MMPFSIQVFTFKHFYPGEWERSSYPTTDKIIPYKLFWLAYRTMRPILALERVNTTQAVVHGGGMLLNGESPALKKLADRDAKEMFGEE